MKVPLHTDETFTAAGWWAGAHGLLPGTASGTQPVEAFHRQWQGKLTPAAGRPTLTTIMPVLADLHTQWLGQVATDARTQASTLRLGVPQANPILLTGHYLHKVKRNCAAELFAQSALPNHYVFKETHWDTVVMAATCRAAPVEQSTAINLMYALQQSGASLTTTLRDLGILTDEAPFFHVDKYNQTFTELVAVTVTERSLFCTCPSFAIYAECEHVYCAEGWPLRGRAPRRRWEPLPARAPIGRPKRRGGGRR